jgi:membrane protease subunit HflC
MSSSDFERAFGESEPPGQPPRRRGRGRDDRPPPNVAKIVALVLLGVVVLMFLLMVATGQGGFVEVQDTQAAVILNYITGSKEVVTTPGYQIFFPFVQQAFVFDKSPQEFVMQGDVDKDANHVAKLTVRANDGSNFWFDEIRIQYELVPENADFVLSDSGTGEAFKENWVRAYARSILRDEFGKYTAVEVADPTAFGPATAEAERRLNETLQQHGVYVIQIITPRPKFEARYEKAIEDRKVADQEVEKLRTRAEQLKQERERRMAEIDSTRTVEYEALKGELTAKIIATERERVKVERDADAYATERLGEAEARRAAMIEEARGLTEKATREAEGLRAITAALEQGGEVLVREELVELLRKVKFTLLPYSRDPAPTRLELLDGGGGTVLGMGAER